VEDEEPDDQQPVRPAVRVPYWQQRNPTAEQHAHATAQRRALLWLAKLYPDTTTQLYQAQAARLPLNPADRTRPGAAPSPGPPPSTDSAAFTPDDFYARYKTELACAKHRHGSSLDRNAERIHDSS
jgi:hypothetical protein